MQIGSGVKRDTDDVAKRYKAMLFVCGSRDQTELSDIFAPIVDFTIVQLMLLSAAKQKVECTSSKLEHCISSGET